MFADFFKNKSILVTGHTGFKGSWLSLWLSELGATVTGLALPPNTEPSHYELIRLQKLITHVEGDIRNDEIVRAVFEKAQPEIVFHLAAQPLVRDSYDDPKTTFDTNIGGTVNILEAIRSCSSVKAAVIVTSDKCYENKEWVWGYRENDPIGGHDPYSASKGATEIVCASYLQSFFAKKALGPHVGIATARAGNVIGGGDWAKDRIIPDCIRSLSSGKPIVVRNPHATRPWQHVLDPLSAYLLLAQRLLEDPERFSGAWNFGPIENGHIQVIDLANKFIAAWGTGKTQTIQPKTDAPHEAHLLRLCIDKAINELRWKPLLGGGDSIDWTVNWYKAWYMRDKDLRSLSLGQIRSFNEIAVKKGS